VRGRLLYFFKLKVLLGIELKDLVELDSAVFLLVHLFGIVLYFSSQSISEKRWPAIGLLDALSKIEKEIIWEVFYCYSSNILSRPYLRASGVSL